MAIITGGLVLLVQGEMRHQHFQLLGFSLVMMASCLAGFRFTITQVILHGTGDSRTPLLHKHTASWGDALHPPARCHGWLGSHAVAEHLP